MLRATFVSSPQSLMRAMYPSLPEPVDSGLAGVGLTDQGELGHGRPGRMQHNPILS
jgi:hypothetical protein